MQMEYHADTKILKKICEGGEEITKRNTRAIHSQKNPKVTQHKSNVNVNGEGAMSVYERKKKGGE